MLIAKFIYAHICSAQTAGQVAMCLPVAVPQCVPRFVDVYLISPGNSTNMQVDVNEVD